ncbi:unnamed protein product [Rangifer tarandus platyrhynchus]|uniref:Uncharacterized protein n=2 Tax=Rangifer tarandus platyrhynchus TaxID=3082113 RepID=A0ABN8Z8L1_RANTA|nr:unnamed protein product [Rangifer tarandus platyrhynchus]
MQEKQCGSERRWTCPNSPEGGARMEVGGPELHPAVKGLRCRVAEGSLMPATSPCVRKGRAVGSRPQACLATMQEIRTSSQGCVHVKRADVREVPAGHPPASAPWGSEVGVSLRRAAECKPTRARCCILRSPAWPTVGLSPRVCSE